jgi:hypothetical protein
MSGGPKGFSRTNWTIRSDAGIWPDSNGSTSWKARDGYACIFVI